MPRSFWLKKELRSESVLVILIDKCHLPVSRPFPKHDILSGALRELESPKSPLIHLGLLLSKRVSVLVLSSTLPALQVSLNQYLSLTTASLPMRLSHYRRQAFPLCLYSMDSGITLCKLYKTLIRCRS